MVATDTTVSARDRGQQLGQFPSRPLGEPDPVVDRDQEGDRQVVGDRNQRDLQLLGAHGDPVGAVGGHGQ